MSEFQLSPAAQQWVNVVLIWIGFGTLAGLLARALVPGHQPAGSVGTIFIGIVGSAVGPLTLTWLLKEPDFNPISPLGFLAAVAGAFVLLSIYRLVLAVRQPAEEE